ncbi:MAG: EamA family transporter, partial [Desulfovibrionaceae bacterium]
MTPVRIEQQHRSIKEKTVRLTINHCKILFALCMVYLTWGSTYIGIKLSLPVLPSFLMCGLRMLLAGLLLYALTWLRGERALPSWADMRQSTLQAFFMVLAASGFLSKGQESVPSGTAAIIYGAVPIWILLGGWLFAGEPRPTWKQMIGLCGGFCGLIWLTVSQHGSGEAPTSGMLWIFGASMGWVAGSLYSKKHPQRNTLSPLQACALILGIGGLQSLLVGLLWGEGQHIHPENITPLALFGFSWLVVGGSLIAYSCYFWLLRNTPITMAISYEYVVPFIGLFLGWLIGGESINLHMLLACSLTVGSVFFIMQDRHRGETRR